MATQETVSRIVDGDTFETVGRPNSIRLNDVDAPEIGQHGAAQATQALINLIGGKIVIVDAVVTDDYGRTVANVTVDGISVNQHMRIYLGQ